MATGDFTDRVEQRLDGFLAAHIDSSPTLEAKLMCERIKSLVLRAGKRSRPKLLQLTYSAYGGNDLDMLVDVGVALELQHQFLLVHDDIMDDDMIRYDGPNMLGYYRQEFPAIKTDVASSMALMAGNLLFTFACQVILDHPTLPDDKKVSVLSLIQETNVGVHAGQQLDIVNVLALKPRIDEEKLLQTDYLKTALYSVRLPMQAAAELLDLSDSERRKIDTFARHFGILYQLTDDYADYFQNASSFESHPKYRDFRQGKLTYPLQRALSLANSADKAFLKRQAGKKHIDDGVMRQIVAILDRSGAQAASREQIAAYRQHSLVALEALAISAKARENFVKMLDSLAI